MKRYRERFFRKEPASELSIGYHSLKASPIMYAARIFEIVIDKKESSLEPIEVKNLILNNAQPVMRIISLSKDQWYRKPAGPRRGPWYSSNYEVLDQNLWKKSEECIYFVKDGEGVLRYVGISVNGLADRWRSSPAYDKNLKSLNRNELFHSQCWPEICSDHSFEKPLGYNVSVLHGGSLLSALSKGGFNSEVQS